MYLNIPSHLIKSKFFLSKIAKTIKSIYGKINLKAITTLKKFSSFISIKLYALLCRDSQILI